MNIPGYYFDPEKKRYFKIVGNQTTPSSGAWSADKVKKRKLEDKKAKEVERRIELNKSRIKRAQALSDPLTGGFLNREHGQSTVDLGASILANGMIEKGNILFSDARWSPSQNLSSMCIVGKEPSTDLGFGYVSPDGSSIASTYIARDGHGRVHRRLLADYSTPGNRIAPYHEFMLDQVSAVKYHRRRNLLLIAQNSPNEFASLRVAVPSTLSPNGRNNKTPCLRLGERTNWQHIVQAGPQRESPQYHTNSHLHEETMARMYSGRTRDRGYYEMNSIAPGPDWSDDIICAAGSNRGMLLWKGEHGIPLSGELGWIAPSNRSRLMADNAFRDIFAVDFKRGHENVIYGGGRPGRCFVVDTRTQDREWQSFRHGSSITHIKSLNEHHALVSGMRNMMQVYDIRMVRKQTSVVSKWHCENTSEKSTGRCITSFPEYKNEAHNKIGLDIDIDAGVVAAAHDDGKVALHSLRTGHQLPSPEVDKIHSNVQERGVVKALQFEKMSGDVHSSLFVAIGRTIKVYSYGATDMEQEP